MREKVLVLGFDALDFTYLNRFADTLPNFSALRSEGVEAPLESTTPPLTPSAWPSMYTGVDPSHHGVTSFFSYGEYLDDVALATRNDVGAPALWNYLTDDDIPSVVLNMPMTHPAEDINGVVVPGYPAPESASAHPDGIRTELAEALGEYRLYGEDDNSDGSGTDHTALCESVDLRRRAAEYLLAEYDWQVGIIEIQQTDEVFHQFDDEAAFREVYEAADEFLGAMRELAGDADAQIVVCSDHGMGLKDGYDINLNTLLNERGFLETKTSDRSMPLYRLKAKETLRDTEPDSASSGDGSDSRSILVETIGTAMTVLNRVGIASRDVRAAAERVGAGPLIKNVAGDITLTVSFEDSQAYSRYGKEQSIWINLDGRQSEGIVSEGEYESLRSELIDSLAAVETPAGERVFSDVKRREDVFSGPRTSEIADILVFPKEPHRIMGPNIDSSVLSPSNEHDHYKTGVFIGAGSQFQATGEHEAMSLTDVAPVVCSLLGIDVPNRMTGTVPDGLLKHESHRRAYGDVSYGTGSLDSGVDDTDEVMNRLENLGYLN